VGDAFYVICEGEVRVVREDDGQTRELARLTHGSFFGEMALLSGAPRTASVESTSEDTQLLEISAPVLAELSKDHPQIATALRKFCRQRMLSNVMESSALFRPFGKRDRRALIQRFRAREVRPGDLVIREGQRSDGLYVVLAGQVEVRKENRVLAQLKEGELFGEMSLLEKTPATATVCATKRTSLLRLPREDFDALILSHPQVLILVSELTEDRRKQNQALRAPPAPPVEGDEPLVLV
jgi:CRP-like cAMP-binding protein